MTAVLCSFRLAYLVCLNVCGSHFGRHVPTSTPVSSDKGNGGIYCWFGAWHHDARAGWSQAFTHRCVVVSIKLCTGVTETSFSSSLILFYLIHWSLFPLLLSILLYITLFSFSFLFVSFIMILPFFNFLPAFSLPTLYRSSTCVFHLSFSYSLSSAFYFFICSYYIFMHSRRVFLSFLLLSWYIISSFLSLLLFSSSRLPFLKIFPLYMLFSSLYVWLSFVLAPFLS